MATRAKRAISASILVAVLAGCGLLDLSAADTDPPRHARTLPTVDEVRADAPRHLLQVIDELGAQGVRWRHVTASGNYSPCTGYETDAPSSPSWRYQATASLADATGLRPAPELLRAVRSALVNDGWRPGADRPGRIVAGIQKLGQGGAHLWATRDHVSLRVTLLPPKSTVSVAISGPRPCQEMTAEEADTYERRARHGRDAIDVEPRPPPRGGSDGR